MDAVSEDRCAHCGLSFGDQENRVEKNGEQTGRASTPRGPMHFACYWKVTNNAAKLALQPPIRRVK